MRHNPHPALRATFPRFAWEGEGCVNTTAASRGEVSLDSIAALGITRRLELSLHSRAGP